jgi:(p)ppGpp synthase/HD superfamily hydrolase
MAESKFKELSGELAQRQGVTNPDALAAFIGRRKLGKKKMAAKAKAGEKKAKAKEDKADARRDKKAGVKEGSKKDEAMDKMAMLSASGKGFPGAYGK